MIALDRRRRLGGRVGEVAEDVQIVERRERAREIRLDEPQDASPGLEAHLHVDSGALLDVVSRGLHESRHLSQLRDDPACPFGLRSIGKQRLAREAAFR